MQGSVGAQRENTDQNQIMGMGITEKIGSCFGS